MCHDYSALCTFAHTCSSSRMSCLCLRSHRPSCVCHTINLSSVRPSLFNIPNSPNQISVLIFIRITSCEQQRLRPPQAKMVKRELGISWESKKRNLSMAGLPWKPRSFVDINSRLVADLRWNILLSQQFSYPFWSTFLSTTNFLTLDSIYLGSNPCSTTCQLGNLRQITKLLCASYVQGKHRLF